MGKLGKKARKFAKKNLQSVYRRKRKTKALFKKKARSKDEQNSADEQEEKTIELSTERKAEGEGSGEASLDAIFSEDGTDMDSEDSEGDEFLSEDTGDLHATESENGNDLEDGSNISDLSMQNRKIHEELNMQKSKLDKLKKKDPDFSKFLETYNKKIQMSRIEEMYSDEDEAVNQDDTFSDKDGSSTNKGKVLTAAVINSCCEKVKENHNESSLISLLNGYRAACLYGVNGPLESASHYRIKNSQAYCDILMCMLHEADNIFRGLLDISSSNCKKETILDLKNTTKWKTVNPLVKSYLRSTLFFLTQATDAEILAFSVHRLGASVIFFAAFPSLLRRLVKTTVHLWATGGGALSSCSFSLIRDVAVVFNSECYDTCLIQAYKAYIAQCNVLEMTNIKHIQFLRNSLVQLCSLDVPKAYGKVALSVQQLVKILQQGLRTKQKEAVKKICSWQYANCIELWVMFLSVNIHDYDLQPLFYATIQLINGVAHLFPGPRYFPFRLKCIQWLNIMSSSSGVFIPVASFALDVLEYKFGKDGQKPGKAVNFLSVLKLPKYSLKSHKFLEECVFSAIEMLAVHFAQWSYHISLPDLATIPLIRLKKFYEITKIEGLRRPVQRLIDQLEQNVDFVQKKRDEVAFSPMDHQNAEAFLQLEKGNNASFIQYYKSVMEKQSKKLAQE